MGPERDGETSGLVGYLATVGTDVDWVGAVRVELSGGVCYTIRAVVMTRRGMACNI